VDAIAAHPEIVERALHRVRHRLRPAHEEIRVRERARDVTAEELAPDGPALRRERGRRLVEHVDDPQIQGVREIGELGGEHDLVG
jgi:hypothetical protein